MADITGQVVIVLKDGLGVISGEAVGERRTGEGDFIVLASGGEFTVDGALIDNQVNVGKVQYVLLEDNEAIAFEGNTFDTAYSLGTPPAELELEEASEGAEPEAEAEGAEEGGEEPEEPTQVAEAVVTVEDIPALVSATVGLTVEGDAPNVSATDEDGQAAQESDEPQGDAGTPDQDGETAAQDEAAAASAEETPAKKAPRTKKTA